MSQQRRVPLWAKALIATVALLTVIFYVGGGFVFANMIHADALTPEPPTPDNGVWVRELEGNEIVITSAEDRDDTTRPGLYGLAWPGGYGQIGEIVATDGLDVTRAFYMLEGNPPPVCSGELDSCEQVDIEGWAYPGDPSSPGLEFSEVDFDSPLGLMGAWLVEGGDGELWAIHVHGWRASRREALRSLTAYHGLGITSLVIDYRNDTDAPADPSGLYRFGQTEWEDVEAAVDYAVNSGAERVVLVGYSTGAALDLAYLENSDRSSPVVGLVFDSPNVDMGSTVRHEAAKRSIPGTPIPVPGSLTSAAMLIADLRWDVDWADIDYASRSGEIIDIPTLVFHGVEDDRVPIEVSRRLAEGASDHVTLIEVEEAGHVTSWNVDGGSYEEALLEFLTQTLEA